MSVHMSVNASDIRRHSVKAFLRAGDPSSGVGSFAIQGVLEQSSNNGAQRCARIVFQSMFGHKILKKIGSFAGDARLLHGCQQTMGPWGYCLGLRLSP
jgi:hypothetical protein